MTLLLTAGCPGSLRKIHGPLLYALLVGLAVRVAAPDIPIAERCANSRKPH